MGSVQLDSEGTDIVKSWRVSALARRIPSETETLAWTVLLLALVFATMPMANRVMGQEFAAGRLVIPLEISSPKDSAGSLIAADVNDDGAYELLVSAPGYVGAYSVNGKGFFRSASTYA